MKILHTVEFYFPFIGGSEEAVKQISERLVKRGHEVTVATTYSPTREKRILNGVKIEDFQISGNAVRGFSGDTANYQKFLQNSKFDIMMNYAAHVWTTDLALPIFDEISAKKVLVPCGFSNLYLKEYNDYFENMKTWIKKYDKCIYLSNDYRDIEFSRTVEANNEIVIPNGAAEEEFANKLDLDIKKALGVPESHFLILHVGSHSGYKGHKEAIKIFKKAHLNHTTLVIVAGNSNTKCDKDCHRLARKYKWNPLSKLFDKRIIVTSLSREATVSIYKQADLFLFPSNIECSPIVLFECMASKTPFLTTDVGNASEIIKWSGAGDILPTIKFENGYCKAEINGSAIKLRNVFNNSNLRQKMKISGYQTWLNKFTWDNIAKQYEEVYAKLLEKPF